MVSKMAVGSKEGTEGDDLGSGGYNLGIDEELEGRGLGYGGVLSVLPEVESAPVEQDGGTTGREGEQDGGETGREGEQDGGEIH